MSAYKEASFDKEKSKCFARWIVFILPIVILSTLVHEPLHRQVHEHVITERTLDIEEIALYRYFWCITTYSQTIQKYNTVIQFVHHLGPFIVNLFSSILFIIIRSVRRRAETQNGQHLREQLGENKQLLFGPVVLLVLSIPRLIISLLSGCTDISDRLWLYLSGYFISFTPSILIFLVFICPSKNYREAFKESFSRICRRRTTRKQITGISFVY